MMPTDPTAPADVRVEQGDREAARAVADRLADQLRDAGIDVTMKVDPSDDAFLIQAFARHRLAASATREVGRAEGEHGLGPHATVIEDGSEGGFMPVAVLVGSCVYIQQGGAQITVTPEVAARLAASLPAARVGWDALPQTIGRVHLGERVSDGERLCSHSHPVPAGHPLYWPERMGEYPDDIDPLCLEHAIEQAEMDQGWCACCDDPDLDHEDAALRLPAEHGWRGIESAPRDGTYFDVWVPSDHGGYRVPDLCMSASGVLYRSGTSYPADLPRWPTHWMRTPRSPHVPTTPEPARG